MATALPISVFLFDEVKTFVTTNLTAVCLHQSGLLILHPPTSQKATSHPASRRFEPGPQGRLTDRRDLPARLILSALRDARYADYPATERRAPIEYANKARGPDRLAAGLGATMPGPPCPSVRRTTRRHPWHCAGSNCLRSRWRCIARHRPRR